jgi:thiol-disulfide isomerase/thioredoxin
VLPECPRLPAAKPVVGGLPDLRLPCLGGGPSVDLADLRGTPTVLNVWAAWCEICNEEMPVLAAGMRRAGDRVRFFGVHYNAAEKYGQQSAADFGVPFASVHDEDGDRVARGLRIAGPPQTFFVTAEGKVAGRKIGAIRSQGELDRLVQRYLGVRL